MSTGMLRQALRSHCVAQSLIMLASKGVRFRFNVLRVFFEIMLGAMRWHTLQLVPNGLFCDLQPGSW